MNPSRAVEWLSGLVWRRSGPLPGQKVRTIFSLGCYVTAPRDSCVAGFHRRSTVSATDGRLRRGHWHATGRIWLPDISAWTAVRAISRCHSSRVLRAWLLSSGWYLAHCPAVRMSGMPWPGIMAGSSAGTPRWRSSVATLYRIAQGTTSLPSPAASRAALDALLSPGARHRQSPPLDANDPDTGNACLAANLLGARK